PLEVRYEVLLVEPGALVELRRLAADVGVEVARQQELHADAGVLEELQVEDRAHQRVDRVGAAVDRVRLVDAVDVDDDADEPERPTGGSPAGPARRSRARRGPR